MTPGGVFRGMGQSISGESFGIAGGISRGRVSGGQDHKGGDWVCRQGRGDGNTYGSLHGIVTAKSVLVVGFATSRLIIPCHRQQLPTLTSQITSFLLLWMQARSSTLTTSERPTEDATEHGVTELTART